MTGLLNLLKRVEFKKDPRVIVFAIVLVAVVGGLVWHGDLSAKEGLAFLGAALALPGLFGAKKDDEPPTGASGLPRINQSDPPPASSGSRLRAATFHAAGVLALVTALFAIGTLLSGCRQALSALDLLARKTQCAIANQDLPDEEILRKCAIDAADAKTILDLVGESRQVAAAKANQAEDRGRVAAALHCHDDAGAR